MKARKNKKRFNPRWHHSERTEDSKEQQTLNEGNIKVNFNSFNMDTWLEEDKGKFFPGGTIADLPREVPREPRSKGRMTPEEKAKADQILKNRKPGTTVYASELEEQEEVAEGGCGGPEMGPEEAEPAITDLSPDEAFGAGYTAAVEEIMASLEGLLGDPIEMGPAPGEMAMDDEEMIVQLPDHAMEMHEGAEPSEIDLAIDKLVDAFQKEREILQTDDPGMYDAIMAVIKARAAQPPPPPPEPGSRGYKEKHGDYLE